MTNTWHLLNLRPFLQVDDVSTQPEQQAPQAALAVAVPAGGPSQFRSLMRFPVEVAPALAAEALAAAKPVGTAGPRTVKVKHERLASFWTASVSWWSTLPRASSSALGCTGRLVLDGQ